VRNRGQWDHRFLTVLTAWPEERRRARDAMALS